MLVITLTISFFGIAQNTHVYAAEETVAVTEEVAQATAGSEQNTTPFGNELLTAAIVGVLGIASFIAYNEIKQGKEEKERRNRLKNRNR